MSSSTTRVSCAEWEAMNERISEADAYVIRNNQEINRLIKLEAERREAFSRRLEENNRALEAAAGLISGIAGSAISDTEPEIRSAIENNRSKIKSQLDALRTGVRNATVRVEAAADSIEEIAHEYDEIISNLADRNAGASERAEFISSELDSMIDQIRALRPQAFASSEYARLERVRTSIAVSLNAGDSQSALMNLQSSILNAGRLLTRLIVLNGQYDAQLSELQLDMGRLQARLDAYESEEGVIELPLGNETVQMDYDIKYWSNGLYDEIVNDISNLSGSLDRVVDDPKPELLDGYKKRIEALNEALSACDIAARKELLATYCTETLAQRMADSFKRRGMTVLSSTGHLDGDSRKPYYLTMGDGNGNTQVMVIGNGKNPEQPDFLYEAYGRTDGMTNLIKNSVSAVLDQEGFVHGSVEVRNDCEENPDADAFIGNSMDEAGRGSKERQRLVRQSIQQAIKG